MLMIMAGVVLGGLALLVLGAVAASDTDYGLPAALVLLFLLVTLACT